MDGVRNSNISGVTPGNSGRGVIQQEDVSFMMINGVLTRVVKKKSIQSGFAQGAEAMRQSQKSHVATSTKEGLMNAAATRAIMASHAFDNVQNSNVVFLPSTETGEKHEVSLSDATTIFGVTSAALLTGLAKKDDRFTLENFIDGCEAFSHIAAPAFNVARTTATTAFGSAAKWITTGAFGPTSAQNDRAELLNADNDQALVLEDTG